MSDKIWKLSEKIPDEILKELSVYPKIIAQLLYNRGIKTKEGAEQFFNPDYKKDLKDPFLILGLEKAVNRIIKAVKNNERIVIYHDYDADGVCGSTVVSSTFSQLGIKFKTYTPDRQKEGYGLNEKAVQGIIKEGVDLLITVDCGITDVDEVDLLNKNNVEVIIIDHHLPAEKLPDAFSIVNPKQELCGYEFKDMCAAGVAFKLCTALLQSELAEDKDVKEGAEKWLLDVVAIATIADMMPLLGENRTLVKYGLMVVKKTKRLGLKKLISGVDRFRNGIDANFVAFQVAPKINATSRMTHASVSYELLNTESEEDADKLFQTVEKANNDRRKFVDKAVKDAIFWMEKDIEERGGISDVIVIGNDEWTPGIVGLISSRLTEKYNRPSFVYGRVGNIFKGSCRSVEGFNIVNAMSECAGKQKDLFKSFGGHKGAGGFAVLEEKITDFKKHMQDVAKGQLGKSKVAPIVKVEANISSDEMNWNTASFLSRFEPYGQANPMPIFSSSNLIVADIRLIGKNNNHLKMKLKVYLKNGQVKFLDAVGFSMGEFYEKIKKNDKIDATFTLEENEWNGNKSLQLKLQDIKLKD